MEYTFQKQQKARPEKKSEAKDRRHQRAADARMRRAMMDAWADPVSSRAHIRAASEIYSKLDDAQGMAYVHLAAADTLRADAHMARLANPIGPPKAFSENISAQTEYASALKLLGHIASDAERSARCYQVSRQQPMHAAMIAQRLRPVRLTLDSVDCTTAYAGGDEVDSVRRRAKRRFHFLRSGDNPILVGDGSKFDNKLGRGLGAYYS